MRFLRLLTKSAAMMHLGMDGFALLMVIVGQEDACRYTRPVSFWNTQLATLLGMRGADEHGLRRVRDRCIKAGWLQYRAGNKQLPASYFVTIPAAVTSLPDSSCDESPQEYRANTTLIPQQTRQESGENPAGIRQESGENPAGIRQESGENPAPSSPSPFPSPIPGEGERRPPTPGKPANAREALAKHLRKLGLPATTEAVTEWADLCSGRAACTSAGNGLAFIAWAVERAKADGINLQYPRQAALYADRWAEKGAA